MKSIYILSVLFISSVFANISYGQTEYDNEVLGIWKGTISGSGLATKNITIVITKSNFIRGNDINKGKCEGYSMVNNGNKTFFSGTITVEADMPILELYEPNTSGKNGKFFLEFGCFIDDELDSELTCGQWTSFDKTIIRNIEVRKYK